MPKQIIAVSILFIVISIANSNYFDTGNIYDSSVSNFYPDFAAADQEKNECKSSEGAKGSCGFSANSLTKGNPRQTASNIAIKAAQEAKAASDAQLGAAEAAGQQVKIQLAERAMQSAKAAEAALAGKQQFMEQFEREILEAEAAAVEITNSLQTTQTNANVANQAAAEATNQLADLKRIVGAATKNLAAIESVASAAQQELVEKTQLLDAAKSRIEGLRRQLGNARQDLEQTKQAAYKAACAAKEAQQKATRTKRMIPLQEFSSQNVYSNNCRN